MVSLEHKVPCSQNDPGAGALVEVAVCLVLAAGALMNENDFVALVLGTESFFHYGLAVGGAAFLFVLWAIVYSIFWGSKEQ